MADIRLSISMRELQRLSGTCKIAAHDYPACEAMYLGAYAALRALQSPELPTEETICWMVERYASFVHGKVGDE